MPSIDLYKHYPMKELTTFKIGGVCRYLIDIHSVDELFEALRFVRQERLEQFILGGGSNTLVSDRGFQGSVLKMNILGIEILQEDPDSVIVKVAAGEEWDQFVIQAGEQGWWGVENLSHIPGKTGALAIQNVGAYGQEASQVIEALDVCEMATGERKTLTHQECHFGYRKSIFNSTHRGKYSILSTTFRLSKKPQPNLSYRDLRNAFPPDSNPSLQSIRQAVTSIRQEKLPEITETGSAGSFFKNCMLSEHEFSACCRKVREMLGDEAFERVQDCELRGISETGKRKVPTALLLDICGLKGFQSGGAALYHKHPLIVINKTGQATAADVMALTRDIRQRVSQQTGIQLKPEPNLLGFSPEERQEYFGLA